MAGFNRKYRRCKDCREITLKASLKLYRCSSCLKIYKQKLKQQDRLNNPDRYKNSKLKANYGITLAQYNQLLVKQGGVCAVCEKSDTGRNQNKYFAVDHCHKTGKVRGLLCLQCNAGLGYLQDNAFIINNLATYLIKNS